LLRRKPRLGQKKLRSRIAAGRRGIRRRRLGGGGAPNKGYQQAYNEGYHSGFAKGFEDGHQSAYEQQV